MDNGLAPPQATVTDIKATRNERGHFIKGIAPNPTGRPKENAGAREFKELIAKDAKYLYNKCMQMLEDPDEPGKVKILIYLIDRLCGKPIQAIDFSSSDNTLPSQMTGIDKAKTYLQWCEDKIAAEPANEEVTPSAS